MSKDDAILLLKRKLENVRKTRRTSFVAIFVLVIVAAWIWSRLFVMYDLLELNIVLGLMLPFVLAAAVVFWVDSRWRKQEKSLLRQIEDSSKGS